MRLRGGLLFVGQRVVFVGVVNFNDSLPVGGWEGELAGSEEGGQVGGGEDVRVGELVEEEGAGEARGVGAQGLEDAGALEDFEQQVFEQPFGLKTNHNNN